MLENLSGAHQMIKAIKNYINQNNEFSQRIKSRHRLFWESADAEIVRNMSTSSSDLMEKWQDQKYWQRKLSNKYNAKQFAISNGCKVAELYWMGADPKHIEFDRLPDQYVIRPTIGHSSSYVFIMDKGYNLFDQQHYSSEQIINALEEKVATTPGTAFLIEEFLQGEAGQYHILSDYKLFCFNGEIAACHLINRTGPKSGFGSCYDEHWNSIESVHPGYPEVGPQPKPACWDEMLAQVKTLSRAYQIFVRLDYYATTKGAVFGEFTPTPGLGNGYSPFGQKLLLSYWDKYCKGLV